MLPRLALGLLDLALVQLGQPHQVDPLDVLADFELQLVELLGVLAELALRVDDLRVGLALAWLWRPDPLDFVELLRIPAVSGLFLRRIGVEAKGLFLEYLRRLYQIFLPRLGTYDFLEDDIGRLDPRRGADLPQPLFPLRHPLHGAGGAALSVFSRDSALECGLRPQLVALALPRRGHRVEVWRPAGDNLGLF